MIFANRWAGDDRLRISRGGARVTASLVVGLAIVATQAARAQDGVGALSPGFCDASALAPSADGPPEGFELKRAYASCAEIADVKAGRKAELDAYGFVYMPRLASAWEGPSPEDDAPAEPEALAALGPDTGADRGATIRALRAQGDIGADGLLRRPASFRVDRSAEVTLDALANALKPGERAEIGRWVEPRGVRLSAEFLRPAAEENGTVETDTAPAATAPQTKLRMTSQLSWRRRNGDPGGVIRVLTLPYKGVDTLRYMRAQLRASAVADRLAANAAR
ncbi:MAG: hypothetical protein AAFW46_15890 [Pseudomonadota bacterium]